MVSGLLNVGKQGIGDVGQQLGLHAGGGVAVLAAHENAVQEDGAAVPLAPQGEQDGQGAGGQGGSHVGLEANFPHDQVGGDRLVGQFLGNFLVVVLDGVGDKQAGAVGAEGAALGEEGRG